MLTLGLVYNAKFEQFYIDIHPEIKNNVVHSHDK